MSNDYDADRHRRTWNLNKYIEICEGIAQQVENPKDRINERQRTKAGGGIYNILSSI